MTSSIDALDSPPPPRLIESGHLWVLAEGIEGSDHVVPFEYVDIVTRLPSLYLTIVGVASGRGPCTSCDKQGNRATGRRRVVGR